MIWFFDFYSLLSSFWYSQNLSNHKAPSWVMSTAIYTSTIRSIPRKKIILKQPWAHPLFYKQVIKYAEHWYLSQQIF